MRVSDFDFDLPKSFIAQKPVDPRDNCRLLVFNTMENSVQHLRFFDIVDFLDPNDVLVLNTSKVIPARIIFSENGKECEIFLLKDLGGGEFLVLTRPGRKFPTGKVFSLSPRLKFEVRNIFEDGSRTIRFVGTYSPEIFTELLALGTIPLPPYLKADDGVSFADYQTIYATEDGSVAAPTAGLHFTENLLNDISRRGVETEELILHVGQGTFAPVKSENISDHKMHSEEYFISKDTASRLNFSRSQGKRFIAVGTTCVRTLESNFSLRNDFSSGRNETDIFIYPGVHEWRVVDGLITNFHLPKSTLLMLVASFLEHKGVVRPRERLLELYELAKSENYRFFSFGDAMFIY